MAHDMKPFTTGCIWINLILLSVADRTILDNIWQFPTECKLTRGGHEYAGQLNVTSNGIPCQPWSSSRPHYNYHVDSTVFPEGSAQGAGNNCRNPDHGYHNGVWCYTTNPNVRWQHCDVNFCECKVLADGTDYEGRLSVTSSGTRCQNWASQRPNRHDFSEDDFPDTSMIRTSNHCRNPRGSRPEGPWCFTVDSEVEWEYCNVSICDVPFVYRSTTAVTVPVTSSQTTKQPSSTIGYISTSAVQETHGATTTGNKATTPSGDRHHTSVGIVDTTTEDIRRPYTSGGKDVTAQYDDMDSVTTKMAVTRSDRFTIPDRKSAAPEGGSSGAMGQTISRVKDLTLAFVVIGYLYTLI